MTRRKRDSVDDILDLTKVNIAGSVGLSTMYSLPSTPTVPAVDVAKGFAGTTFGLVGTMKGAGALLRSVGDLEKIGKRKRK